MTSPSTSRLVFIEQLAEQVFDALGGKRVPVDVLEIARQEGIELAPGEYTADFSGRIEYHRSVGAFILFYPDLSTARYQTVVRFSIAHELGHYYIPEHADLLRAGQFHSSTTGFICDNQLEREADHFAGNLLLPNRILMQRLQKRGYLTLDEILTMAQYCAVSATAAAIRYVRFTGEACAMVLSRQGEILYSIASQEAAGRGFAWLGQKSVPKSSPTWKATEGPSIEEVMGGPISSSEWYSTRERVSDVWEESYCLGQTGYTLTLLALNP